MMRVGLFSGDARWARPLFAALAILAMLGLATPSASAAVTLSYTVDGGASTGLTSGVSKMGSGGVPGGDISYTLTATAGDTAVTSALNTVTIDINNSTTTTETITFVVTGTGYTMGGLAAPGFKILAAYSVSGTGGPAVATKDAVTVSSTVAGTSLGSSVGTTTTNPIASIYTFTPAVSPVASITLGGSTFTITQTLAITLGAHDSSSITLGTLALPNPLQAVPEPSGLAIAGLGGLGMIGFGLRRRKAMGV